MTLGDHHEPLLPAPQMRRAHDSPHDATSSASARSVRARFCCPRTSFPSRAQPSADPHFFLLVVLNGGADSSYMFDARPLSMTKAGKIQNYLGKEPDPWIGKNGVTTLATSLIKPLDAVPRPLQRAQRRVHGAELRRPSAEHEFPVRRAIRSAAIRSCRISTSPKPAASRNRSTPSFPTDPLFINVDNHSGVVPLRPGLGARPFGQRSAMSSRRSRTTSSSTSCAHGSTANAGGTRALLGRLQSHARRRLMGASTCTGSSPA